ncbi:TPA: YadA-like family protein [Stenotrophomonas maltophilia]|nr:YadA-like family protein [Stenotrophomonas maltophilia]
MNNIYKISTALALLLASLAANASVIVIGEDAKGSCEGAIAIGDKSESKCVNLSTDPSYPYPSIIPGIAIGRSSIAAGDGISIGNESTVTNTGINVGNRNNIGGSTAIGNDIKTTGKNSEVAIGFQAQTGDAQSVAINGKTSLGPSVAINGNSTGYGGTALNGFNSGNLGVSIAGYTAGTAPVAVGYGSQVGDFSPFGTTGTNYGGAFGSYARVRGGDTMSTALGAFSDTEGRINVISVGNSQPRPAGNGTPSAPITYRQIINVAAGTQDHDAVNLKQLNDALAGVPTTPGTGNPYFAAKGDPSKNDPALATGEQSVAGGPSARAAGNQSSAYGSNANASGEGSTAAGNQANAYADQSTAVGAFASATAKCTAIGYGAQCSEDGTVSFGRQGEDKRLKNVAGGIEDNDAANTGQVRAVDLRVRQTQTAVSRQAVWFGGGASYDPTTGIWTNPSFAMPSGPSFNNVNDALVYLDNRIGASSPGTGPQGPVGADGADGRSAYEVAVGNGYNGTEKEWLASLKGADGKDGVGGGSGSKTVAGKNIEVSENQDGTQTVGVADNVVLSENGSVKIGATTVDAKGVSIEGGPSMTRDGINAGNQRVTGVAAGRIEKGSTDAVNGGQIYDMQTALNDRWDETNRRIDRQDRRIDAMGAQVAAMSMMAAANVPAAVGEVQASAGIGFSGSEAALAVGWRSRITERTSVSGGFSYSARGKAMGGVGVSINLGR